MIIYFLGAMMDQPPHPRFSLDQLPGLAAGPRKKLGALGIETLEDLCRRCSRSQLGRIRQIGPKTQALLLAAVHAAGLCLPEYPPPEWPDEQPRREVTGDLQASIDAWVERHRPRQWRARAAGKTGAYGDYLTAQLDALDHLVLDSDVRQQQRHRIVRLMGRYQREVRFAATREAMREGARARG